MHVVCTVTLVCILSCIHSVQLHLYALCHACSLYCYTCMHSVMHAFCAVTPVPVPSGSIQVKYNIFELLLSYNIFQWDSPVCCSSEYHSCVCSKTNVVSILGSTYASRIRRANSRVRSCWLHPKKSSPSPWSRAIWWGSNNTMSKQGKVFVSWVVITVCVYRLVMISIDLSETAHFAHWKSETMSETNFSDNFLSDKFFFPTKFFPPIKNIFLRFFSDWILSRILSRFTYCSCISYAIIYFINIMYQCCFTIFLLFAAIPCITLTSYTTEPKIPKFTTRTPSMFMMSQTKLSRRGGKLLWVQNRICSVVRWIKLFIFQCVLPLKTDHSGVFLVTGDLNDPSDQYGPFSQWYCISFNGKKVWSVQSMISH